MIKNGLKALKKNRFLTLNGGKYYLASWMQNAVSLVKPESTPENPENFSEEPPQIDRVSMVTQTCQEIDSTMLLEDAEIGEYSSRITNQKDILHEILTKVKKSVQLPFQVTSQKRLASFKPEYQKKWEETENDIILALLHQTDILKLFTGTKSNKEAMGLLGQKNIEEQLAVIARKRNEVFNHMLIEMQSEKEFQQTVETLIEEIVKKLDPDCKETSSETVKGELGGAGDAGKDNTPLKGRKKSIMGPIQEEPEDINEKKESAVKGDGVLLTNDKNDEMIVLDDAEAEG